MITIRAFLDNDTEPVQIIMAECTRELRTIYAPKPRTETDPPQVMHTGSRIVAVDQTNSVIGIAECITQVPSLYVQGIAVSLAHRHRGVATALLAYITKLATDLRLTAVTLITIKETANVEIFQRLGFDVISEQISERFLGQGGNPVTEVTLKRQIAQLIDKKKQTS